MEMEARIIWKDLILSTRYCSYCDNFIMYERDSVSIEKYGIKKKAIFHLDCFLKVWDNLELRAEIIERLLKGESHG